MFTPDRVSRYSDDELVDIDHRSRNLWRAEKIGRAISVAGEVITAAPAAALAYDGIVSDSPVKYTAAGVLALIAVSFDDMRRRHRDREAEHQASIVVFENEMQFRGIEQPN